MAGGCRSPPPRCKEGAYREGLKLRCLRLLVRRTRSLGLRTRPDKKENNLLRKASDFALDVRTRRQVRRPGEIAAHVKSRYRESHEFLEMGSPGKVEEMVMSQAPLAMSVSSQMNSLDIANACGVECSARCVLDLLEPMLRFRKGKGLEIRKGVLNKWRNGMRGDQMREFIFEMDLYLRFARIGADVEADVRPGGKKGGGEVDLRVSGCLVEAYSPLDKEIFVHGHVSTIANPGERLMDSVAEKRQVKRAGQGKIVVVVDCSEGDYVNVAVLRTKVKLLLRAERQPGAAFFVHNDGKSQHVECLVNSKSVAKIPKQTIWEIKRALELTSLHESPRMAGRI